MISGATEEQTLFREVNVPDKELESAKSVEEKLELIFRYGQNDFQPIEFSPSVSVGDQILYDNKRYLVKFTGFEKLTKGN